MDTFNTKYGSLNGVVAAIFHANGSIAEVELEALNTIETPYGTFIPQYEEEDVRRKQIKPLTFHQNGTVASISLQTQQIVQTPLGTVPAEYLVFYESGAIKRIFPRNGKITGFWSEENEYELANEIQIQAPFGFLKKKLIGIYFYEDGAVKSLTFWSQDSLPIPTPAGTIETRTGVSFYPQGELKSVEPKYPTPIDTPIGEITAFNSKAIGIHGDSNSLCFTQTGQLKSLMTSTDRIIITDQQGNQTIVQPGSEPSGCNIDVMETVPLGIEFDQNKVRFNQKAEYDLTLCTFTVETGSIDLQNQCEAVKSTG